MQLIATHNVVVAAMDTQGTVAAGDMEVQVATGEGAAPIPSMA